MRRVMTVFVTLALLVPLAHGESTDLENRVAALEAKVEKGGGMAAGDFKVYWDNGLRIDIPSVDGKFKIGGRILNDWAFFRADDDLEAVVGDNADGAEFRSARLYISGDLQKNYGFKAAYDMASGDADFKDVYLAVKKLPGVGGVRLGLFSEPFSLDASQSTKYSHFMERGLTHVFSPGRNTGIMNYNTLLDKRMTYAAGIFRDGDSYGDDQGDGEYAFTTRVTGLPVYENEGRTLVHVGAGYSYRGVHEVDLDTTPESHMAQDFADTGAFDADSVNQIDLAAAVVAGPLSAQTEFIWYAVDSDTADDPQFTGWYVFVSYFLTQEARNYITSRGTFGRVSPNKSFLGADNGPGAWEIAARYSNVDLDDGNINGGELTDYTLGVNWYLTPNVRVMFNYIYAQLTQGTLDEAAHIGQMRAQIDF